MRRSADPLSCAATRFNHVGFSLLPPPARRSRVVGRADSGEARAGWGVLPRGASSTIGRWCRWLPWPNRRIILVALSPRPATPHPYPSPPLASRAGGGRCEKPAWVCRSRGRGGPRHGGGVQACPRLFEGERGRDRFPARPAGRAKEGQEGGPDRRSWGPTRSDAPRARRLGPWPRASALRTVRPDALSACAQPRH
jgi:hypothetical protein